MSATTLGAVLLFAALFILIVAIKTAPERRRRSAHPLQDAYAEPDDENPVERPKDR